MRKKIFVFLTALLMALCMVALVACGDKGGETNFDNGELFPDGASIEEVIAKLESGDVKITSCKFEGYDISNIKNPEYEIGFSNNKFIYHIKAYGFIEGFFVCDFNALSIGQMVRSVNEKGQVTDERGEPIGLATDETVGWTVGLVVQIDDDDFTAYFIEHGMSETDFAMRKINDAIISLMKEQKGLKEGGFSCKDNSLNFERDSLFSEVGDGTSFMQNIKKMYDFNVPIELPKIIEEKIAEQLEKEKASQGK